MDGERCEITKLDQPQKESVQSEWSRPVSQICLHCQVRSRDARMFEWMRRVSLYNGWWVQAGSQSRVSSKDGGASKRHGPVREDTAEVEKAMIASDAKRVRKMETEEMTGDPPASAGSSKEMTGDPPASAGASKEMPGDPPASAGASKEMTGDPPASAGASKEMTGDPPASAGASKEMTGDPPASAGSSKEMTGDPPASAGASKEMTGDPPASAGASKEMTGDPPASAGSSKEMTGDPPVQELRRR